MKPGAKNSAALCAEPYTNKFLMIQNLLGRRHHAWKKQRRQWLMMLASAALVAGCSTVPRDFAPIRPLPADRFSHQSFGAVLRAHVSNGVVDYPAIAADSRFPTYLDLLDRVDPRALPTRDDRLAFWINAYNAFAIQGILEGYSPRTLWGRYGYFIGQRYAIGGRRINLYDLEQKLLIPDYQEPRIHFAIVCASQSCPRLPSEPFGALELERQLEAGAREFVNDPVRNRFDREAKVAYLSMIFHWFEQDFAAHAGSLLAYVARYVADPELARDLQAVPYQVEFLPYDWSLNGVSL